MRMNRVVTVDYAKIMISVLQIFLFFFKKRALFVNKHLEIFFSHFKYIKSVG